MVLTTLVVASLKLLGLMYRHLLCWIGQHCMNYQNVICLASLRHSLLVLASAPLPLPGLCLSRQPQRSPHVVDMVASLTVKCPCNSLLKIGMVEHRHGQLQAQAESSYELCYSLSLNLEGA